jgi:hypothetical protein
MSERAVQLQRRVVSRGRLLRSVADLRPDLAVNHTTLPCGLSRSRAETKAR